MIRFGMGLMEIVEQLTRGFMKATGKQPGNLEKLKIQQEAVQRFKDMNKVMDMQGRPIDPSKPIMGGSQQGEALKSGIMKATGARPRQVLSEDEIRQKLLKNNEEGLASMKSKIDDPEERAMGGRIGYSVGAGKKGVQALLDLVRDKFGKKSITTADKAPIPPKTLERDMFKAADKRLSDKREMTEDEIYDFAEEIGGELDAYDFDGTVGSAKRILKEHKEYMDDMYRQYRMGKLDPEPGDKSEARKIFLQNKLDEMEATGDKKLMTVDEIEELSNFDLQSEMDVAKSLAPKMTERLELKQKYPGITDDLLDKILIDDNVQRKAEVLATIDEAFKMMEKGKSSDEILDTMKNVTRTKQADGGIMRANFVGGGMGRRGFLKMLGGVGAGIGALKTGILGFGGKGATKEVAKEVVKNSSGKPPAYFFKLAEKIKKFGSDSTPTNERTISKSLKSKDGTADYILEEDMATGDIQIKKVNMERDDMINDIEIMEFRKGEVVEGPGGKPVKTPDEYDEVTESISRIYKDNFNDPDYSEGIRVKEVMEEVMDAPSIKKASGGIARMLGE